MESDLSLIEMGGVDDDLLAEDLIGEEKSKSTTATTTTTTSYTPLLDLVLDDNIIDFSCSLLVIDRSKRSADRPRIPRPGDWIIRRKSQASSHILSTLSTEESSSNVNSEKELGNEYFKQKKAYLKIKRETVADKKIYEHRNCGRQITFVELELATSSFSESNYIGEGGFGLVYKGLLQHGSIVAIKRRLHGPSQNFVQSHVESIGRIHHRHLVKLIGCCQENHQQLLVSDYLPNGNVVKLIGCAAKDISERSNVLLDENFAAKVSDFGLSKLVMTTNRAGSSLGVDCFLDPELGLSDEFSPRSDVYSFGECTRPYQRKFKWAT